MAYVSYSRWMDAAVMGIFLCFLSGLTLHLMGEFWSVCQQPHLEKFKLGFIAKKCFPFKRSFDFNLTHILLMAIVICLLSLRPGFELQKEEEEKQKATEKRSKKKRRDKSDEKVDQVDQADE
ncbi:MAG: uncharacterized protein KVP18_002798 [Porospora cf. gigantea A]|uniref:uncharacterized protein n=1 Tax=Porospora cf. gigantea A TaxID=2853593 RepID=UPI00355A5DE4|nr:MAG: hypothetical protein KVP18_002798 [Porospora cf. gigantea A]